MIKFTGHRLDAVVVLTVDADEMVQRLLQRAADRGPRRRHRGRHPAPPGGLRRADRAADRGLPRARHLLEVDGMGEVDEVTERIFDALDASRRAERRPDGASATAGSRSRRPTRSRTCAPPGLVVGADPRAAARGGAARASPPASSTRSPRRTSATAAPCRRSWATATRRSRRPSAPRSTTRSCTASPATGCSRRRHHLDRLRRDRRRLARRRRDHGRRRRGAADAALELMRVTEEAMWAGIAAARLGRPGHRHLARGRGHVAARRRRLRHPRGLHRPRHRHRHAPAAERAQLRPAGRGPKLVAGWRSPSSRWSPWASKDTGARRRLDRRHRRRLLGRALRAHLHPHPARCLGAHRPRRGAAKLAESGCPTAGGDADGQIPWGALESGTPPTLQHRGVGGGGGGGGGGGRFCRGCAGRAATAPGS